MTQPQGSFIHQQGSIAMTQPQGSFPRSEGYMEMFQPQGSYFNQKGSSARVQGSMDYPPRPSTQTFPRSNIFQDQGSFGSQPLRSSEIHDGDFIHRQTIASSGPTITADM
ncbi:hypothetical protein Hanom_Chr07g00602341 [Helianthus anomalus]